LITFNNDENFGDNNEKKSKIENLKNFLEFNNKYKKLNIFNEEEGKQKKIILIKELPYVNNNIEKKERNQILLNYVNDYKHHIIILLTITETSSFNSILFKEFSPELISKVKLIQLNPITETKIKKKLLEIMNKEEKLKCKYI
jgi:hypothetical protein